MRFLRLLSAALCAVTFAAPALADPDAMTCRFLEVLGSNDQAAVPGMMEEIAGGLSDDRLASATESLTALIGAPIFEGGSAWRIAAFGEELQEHLVLLRLAQGGVAGGRLRYEWSADGTSLVNMEFQRQYSDFMRAGAVIAPERIDCGN